MQTRELAQPMHALKQLLFRFGNLLRNLATCCFVLGICSAIWPLASFGAFFVANCPLYLATGRDLLPPAFSRDCLASFGNLLRKLASCCYFLGICSAISPLASFGAFFVANCPLYLATGRDLLPPAFARDVLAIFPSSNSLTLEHNVLVLRC